MGPKCDNAIHVRLYVQVLEVATRELGVRDNLDLTLTLLGDLDNVAEVADTAVDLDAVLEELLEGGNIKDLVRRWLRSIDDELLGDLGLLALGGFLFFTLSLSLLFYAETNTAWVKAGQLAKRRRGRTVVGAIVSRWSQRN